MSKIITPLLIALIFIIYQSWPLFVEGPDYNDDQNNIYLLATRRGAPTFLAEDYAYGNSDFLRFYTPLYLDTVHYLMIGLGSYDAAMVALHSLMLPIYLLTMFILLHYLSGDIWVALIVTLFSALARPAMASELWGAAGMRLVYPRTAFLAIAPFLFWLTFRWLSRPEWQRVALLGLLGGLSANLHPPSGMFFIQIFTTLILTFGCASFAEAIWKIGLIALTSILGGLPTFIPLLQNLRRPIGDQETPPFDRFAAVVHERLLSIMPLPADQVMLPGGPLTYEQQFGLAIAGMILGVGLVFVALWQKSRRQLRRRPLIAWLLLITLPLAYLVTIFSALDLILVTLAYWVVRLVRQDEDQLDLYALGILSCAAIYSYVGSAMIGQFWETFEVWPLTAFYSEQPRMSRFVYLPLFIFMARWMVLLLYQNRNRIIGVLITTGLIAGMIVRHWHFRDPWGMAEWGMAASLLLLALAGIWSCLEWHWPSWTESIIFGIIIAAVLYLWLYILGVPYLYILVSLTVLAGGLLYYFQILSLSQWQWGAALIVIIATGWLFAHGKVALYNERPLRVQAYKTLNLYQYPGPDQRDLDAQAMRNWIKANTPPYSVFYYNDRQLEFRAQTHRAVTHSWKDLGGAYYTPVLLIEYYDRFKKLEAAYESPQRLLTCARAYRADYIVAQPQQPDLPLPLVYSNDSYRVYAVEKVAIAAETPCL
jgi:hypothetical protein